MAEILAQQVEATHTNMAAEAVTVVEAFTVVEGVEGNLKDREVNLIIIKPLFFRTRIVVQQRYRGGGMFPPPHLYIGVKP
jgi:hypothetical protein